MTITRTINGTAVEIELTAQEMRDAYEEQQHKYDCDDVRTLFNSFDDDDLIEDYGFDAPVWSRMWKRSRTKCAA